ncbi:MAG: precorrin-2 C(20)-methyltransferase [Coriobacteriales bacterium]|jgi:precorrin-2/cobalt-factor-2 C20-methyltransferase
MSGILYGLGVGPGDPELMTLKAVRTIRENDVIALPGEEPRETTAFKIAVQAVPELAEKELIPMHFPMVMDRREQNESHCKGAKSLEKILDSGKNVVFLTLGDVTVYSTFTYIQHFVKADGYKVELINGIPSFCAAAATLGIPLAEWTQPLHIIPASHSLGQPLAQPGTYVLMKSGSKMKDVKVKLGSSDRDVFMVENCGMPDEKCYHSLDEIPDDAGYFSLIITKEKTPGYDVE